MKLRNITSDEYDLLCDATNESNDRMHWQDVYSWTETYPNGTDGARVYRGGDSARYSEWNHKGFYGNLIGFRAAFESLTPDTDCTDLDVGDVVMMGTLYVGDAAVKIATNPTKNGDITSYGEDCTKKITLGTALEDSAYQVKAVYVGNGLFVCDRVVLNYISGSQVTSALTAG